MKLLSKALTLIAALSLSFSAAADNLTNVKDFDPALLVGKTCKGGASSGLPSEREKAGIILQFNQEGDTLVADTSRRTGTAAFEGKEFELPFENFGKVKNLQVSGSKISYVTNLGAIATLEYKEGKLVGLFDLKTNNPGKNFPRDYVVNLSCA